jgi:hypothetical protein
MTAAELDNSMSCCPRKLSVAGGLAGAHTSCSGFVVQLLSSAQTASRSPAEPLIDDQTDMTSTTPIRLPLDGVALRVAAVLRSGVARAVLARTMRFTYDPKQEALS